jgi:hypothetical protein
MEIDQLVSFLIWCAGINYAILIIWFGVFLLAHDWLFRLHSRWFKISVETFDKLNYLGMAIYKIGVMLFVLVPLAAFIIVYGSH